MIGALAMLVLAAPVWSVELVDCGAQKIAVIKVVRAVTGLGLKDAKDLVEATPRLVKAGLEKAEADALATQLAEVGAVVSVTNKPGAPPGRTAGLVTVTLVAVGEQKIAVIKVVREVTGLGLKEAKDLVEAAPKVVKEGLRNSEAEGIAERLRQAGATVKVSGGSP